MPAPTFSTDSFSIQKGSGTFITEASSLNGFRANERIGLVSSKTGNTAWFVLSKINQNKEREIESWLYEVSAVTVNDFPHLRYFSVIIFND